jgi:hypothetical protein
MVNYTRPEIVVLGAAVRVIETRQKGCPTLMEVPTGRTDLCPAYDLDE